MIHMIHDTFTVIEIVAMLAIAMLVVAMLMVAMLAMKILVAMMNKQ